MSNIKPVENVKLTAVLPQEMITAQTELISWATRKVEFETAEAQELEAAYLHAKKNKWKNDTLKAHAAKAAKRVIYYTKLLAAAKEGYYIVPNMPCSVFAIRTAKVAPKDVAYYATWQDDHMHLNTPQELPEGEGVYQKPMPVIGWSPAATTEKPHQKRFSTRYWDEFDFPISMAKPEIMAAFSRAAALKIFDQFGILPAEAISSKNVDPMIVGQIRIKNGYNTRLISFMIAWHLDTKVL